jgi:ribosome-binding ATPase
MGFECGIVGLPNVGKSTLFNALTNAAVAASNYPFCTIEPNVGMVPVPDPRLDKLAELVPTESVVSTTVRFVDIAGLVKGASDGEGLGNQFLGHIAQVDAIVHLVRCFEDSETIHTYGSVDPKRDIEVIDTELVLRDLGIVQSAVQRLDRVAKTGDKEAKSAVALYRKLEGPLDQGTPVRRAVKDFSSEERSLLKPLNLLTDKPVMYVANVGEKESAQENPHLKVIQEIAQMDQAPVVSICASLEAQIAQLESPEEQKQFLEAEGLSEPGLHRVIRAGHDLLNLITFFTVGPKEDRAWTIRRGVHAQEAAGKIHSDISRGFIRAEVIGYEDFIACGSEAAAKEQGKLRLEGKEYPVQDGDLIHFRFSV